MKWLLAAAAAVGALAAAPATALAGDVEAGRNLEVSHSIEFVLLENWEIGDEVRVDVFRGATLIATKQGTVQPFSGSGAFSVFEINHVGGDDCWEGVPAGTPDIRPGDKVVATVLDDLGADTADRDYTFVRDVQFEESPPGTLTGHARGNETAPETFDLAAAIGVDAGAIMEAKRVGAPVEDDVPFEAGDLDGAGNFSKALGGTPGQGEVFIDWVGETADGGSETSTAFPTSEPAELPCGPLQATALTSNTHPVINIANQNTPMVVGGPELGPTTVATLSFAGVPYDVTHNPDGSWSATIPGADVAGLAPGSHALVATFSDASTQTQDVLKDVTAPDLSATPGSGAYVGNQSVALASNGGEAVRFTQDGSVPSNSSRLYDGTPVELGPGNHTIRVFSVDAAGNRSDETFEYAISAPQGAGGAGVGAGTGAAGGGAGAGGGPVVVTDPPATFRVRTLRARSRIGLRQARRRGITARFIAPEGTQAVRASLYLNTNASSHRTRRLVKRLTTSATAGRLSVRFSDRRTRRKLRRGVYTLSVAPSSDGTTFAEGTAKRFRIR